MKDGCDQIREALSARLDGEQSPLAPGVLEAHLAGCRECGEWLANVEEVTMAVRGHALEAPDLTVPILAAVRAGNRDAARQIAHQRGRATLRLALALTAMMQLAMAIPMLLGLGEIAHTSREAASFDIAVAVGFGIAAWRPDLARAFVPVAFVLAGCLILTSVFDIVEGAARFAHEVGHIAALAQAALLWGLSRDGRHGGRSIPRRREAAIS
ncbi:MAG TPA: zf-HC2 domain-containing protein [Candidatus Limnocylindrales bacterium]|nr:zf-HC2 domain-containing protein [Candidatus Limnocylindrales bacterium]